MLVEKIISINIKYVKLRKYGLVDILIILNKAE